LKKITFLIVLACTISYAQQSDSYLEVTTQTTNSDTSEAVITGLDGRQPLIDTYTTLVDFQDAVTANCADPTLTSEDFGGGPGGITGCGPVVSSAGDGCFPVGELEDGFMVEASNITDVVNIPPGAIGNVDSLVGASAFVEFTIITFSPDVYAVAMDIWENNDPTTEVRIYGSGGGLIETLMVNTPTNAQTFFGFISDEPVESIELEGLNGSGELFGNFLFGGDCTPLGVNDNALSQISIYPNPATTVINVEVPGSIEINAVVLFDVLGKRMNTSLVNGQINIAELSNGVYLMQIETNEGTITRKMLKR
jgi:hypothetical protein